MSKPNREIAQTHNVFLSWSGERSLYVAKYFRDWLPKVLYRSKPWLSDVDIDKGTMGLDEIRKALAGMRVGVFFLTPENRDSSWISYEAGSLAKELSDKNRVCTYLLAGLQVQHISGPLGMFQRTKPEESDTRKLIHTINKAIGDEVVPESHLDIIFDRLWPELKIQIEALPPSEELSKPLPSIDDMIAEILELNRAAANSRKQAEWIDKLAPDFKDFMPMLVEFLKGIKPSQLLPMPAPPPPPRDPKATFSIKLAGDPKIKRVEGTAAAETAIGQVVILVGNEVVAKFESVEGWWKETAQHKSSISRGRGTPQSLLRPRSA
jgi:hypothetical protein